VCISSGERSCTYRAATCSVIDRNEALVTFGSGHFTTQMPTQDNVLGSPANKAASGSLSSMRPDVLYAMVRVSMPTGRDAFWPTRHHGQHHNHEPDHRAVVAAWVSGKLRLACSVPADGSGFRDIAPVDGAAHSDLLKVHRSSRPAQAGSSG
jgi:hypothetical protein